MDYIFVPGSFETKRVFKSQRHINVSSPYHVNFEMEFILVSKGTVKMCIQGTEYRVNAGQVCFCMPFEPHSFDTDKYSECHVLMFTSDLIKNFFDFLMHNKPDKKCFDLSADIFSVIDRILPNDTNEADTVDALACIAPICSEIKHKCTFSEDKNQYDDIFLQALTIANESYTSQITLESVAHNIGINPATLSRKFAENAKVNFSTYINSLRCFYAANQIIETGKTFSDIAYQSGFGSIRNFNRIFQKHMNCTPSEFRDAPCEIQNTIHINKLTADL